MYMYKVVGGQRLVGDICAGAAKNSALPVLAASLLSGGEVSIKLPDLSDVDDMLGILSCLGCRIKREDDIAVIDPSCADRWVMPEKLSKKIRSSIFMLGPILARNKNACFTYPGGCEIGLRPIDIHLSGLRQLGIDIEESSGMIHCRGNLIGARLHLDYPSVGATENLMMAGVLAKGETVIDNPATEPEIVDLARFLKSLGARIKGEGSSRIVIEGVKSLGSSAEVFCPISDRIVAGTLLAACAGCGGDIYVRDARAHDMTAIIHKLRQMGCQIIVSDGIRIRSSGELSSFRDIATYPHPGFPTDMQAQMAAIACVARGTSSITENVFENRFGYVNCLKKMGADISVHGRTAIIRGVKSLEGAKIEARDLRGGAALTIAALAAKGESEIGGVEYIDRGYSGFENMLSSLGADIKREICTKRCL
ncbi:MAG: UDP-N-acetylglucosamine 1-carboxyvinyltransferase [Clostridiales bacterium]|nr:UDP-N-acetylglucosamine 1-carboxyvinyltransferase [Clostridiales bacterium]